MAFILTRQCSIATICVLTNYRKEELVLETNIIISLNCIIKCFLFRKIFLVKFRPKQEKESTYYISKVTLTLHYICEFTN